MSLAILALAVIGAPSDVGVRLAGNPEWTEPLAALLSSRFNGAHVGFRDNEPGDVAWRVRVLELPEGEALDVTVTDPSGAKVTERWPVPQEISSQAMQVRSLALWVTGLLHSKTTVPWKPAQRPSLEHPIQVPQLPSDPMSLRLGVAVGASSDLGSPSVSPAAEVRLRVFFDRNLWLAGALLIEPTHSVAGAEPIDLRRFSAPFRLTLGLRAELSGWSFEAGAGPAVRVVRFEMPDLPTFDRLNVGGVVEGALQRSIGDFTVGATAAFFVWGRRQEIRQLEAIIHPGAFSQLWVGLTVGVGWSLQ